MTEPTQKKTRGVRIRFTPVIPPPAEGDDPLVAAANPRPSWILHVDAAAFDLWHPLDLESSDTLKCLAIEREIQGVSSEAYLTRVRDQVSLLVPDLSPELRDRLSGHQLLAIGIKSWQRQAETKAEAKERTADAANPPDGERDSASSSRSPAASTVGATAS